MKIGIHHNFNSFSERWIEYCNHENISYKLVNAFDNNIVEQLKDCDLFMWHHHHAEYKDILTAKRILFSLEHAGVKVFPDFKTGWHFDDKVSQKYLLEALGVPLVPSYVFFDKKTALEWARNATYPKVFKLKGGAGASNVKLVKTHYEAINLINKGFGRGFSQFDKFGYFKENLNNFLNGKGNFIGVLKGFARLFFIPEFAKNQGGEKGYIYFQEFLPNNMCDIRVVIIDKKAFAIKRLVRDNDFRASGSGSVIYDPSQIDKDCIKIAFDVSQKANFQCTAYDFIYNKEGVPLIIEISYGFSVTPYDECPGYWDSQLNWYEGKFNPQGWMVEALCNELRKSRV